MTFRLRRPARLSYARLQRSERNAALGDTRRPCSDVEKILTAPLRVFTLALMLWIGVDLANPNDPGVFSFERPHLFLEGAVDKDPNRASDAQPGRPSEPERDREPSPPPTSVSRIALGAPRVEMDFVRPHVMIGRTTPSIPPPPSEDH